MTLLNAYRRGDGAFLLVPHRAPVSLAADAVYGPLTRLGLVDRADLAAAVRAQVDAQLASRPYALLPAPTPQPATPPR